MKRMAALILLICALTGCAELGEYAAEVDLAQNGERFGSAWVLSNGLYFVKCSDFFERESETSPTGAETVRYRNGTETIEFDLRAHAVSKNGLTLLGEHPFFLYQDELYAERAVIERLLPVSLRYEAEQVTVHSLTDAPYAWTKHRLVAHALGELDGIGGTCSLEAFEASYQAGFRLFECDFILTLDGGLIARHDWMPYLYEKLGQTEPEGNGGNPLTMEEIKGMPILGTLTPLSFSDVAELMRRFQDVFLITDTKETDPALIRRQFEEIVNTARAVDPSILDRIIPQFYHEEMYRTVMDVYAFKSVVYTLYMTEASRGEVLGFAAQNGLRVITMDWERADAEYLSLLNARGISVYLHTLNSLPDMLAFAESGVRGFYTGSVTPLLWNALPSLPAAPR